MDEALETGKTKDERRVALGGAGITLEGDLGEAGRKAGSDDVLDAAAATWSAQRILSSDAISLPSPSRPALTFW